MEDGAAGYLQIKEKWRYMKSHLRLLFFLSVLLTELCVSCNKGGKNTDPEDEWPAGSVRSLRENLNYPWEILWGKDNFIWMTERGGKISKIDPRTGADEFSFTISDVVSQGEGGLLGMVQHPDFLLNGYLYVVYNYNNGGNYREKLVRYTYADKTLKNPFTLIENIPASSIHNGSRLFFTPGADPKLLMSTGDASNSSSAQDPASPSGKLLRLNPDGSIPSDNPVSGNPYWTIGHRNIQGLVIGKNTIYTSEHGPTIEDEVNSIEKGRNYGWPQVNGPCNGSELTFCTANTVKEPIWSTGNSTLAVSGMEFYDKDLIPEWKNSLLLATLKDATLYQLQLGADGKTVTAVKKYFDGKWNRLRDICVSPEGRVYLCSSNGGNKDVLVEISSPE